MQANPTSACARRDLTVSARAVGAGRGPVSRRRQGDGQDADTSERCGVRACSIRCNGALVYAEPPPPDESFMLELRRRFKGEVVALSEYLDRDLVTLWGYDEPD